MSGVFEAARRQYDAQMARCKALGMAVDATAVAMTNNQPNGPDPELLKDLSAEFMLAASEAMAAADKMVALAAEEAGKLPAGRWHG